MPNQNLPKLCLFLEEMVAQRKLIQNTERKSPLISKESIPLNTFESYKDDSIPFVTITLRCTFQAICGYQNLSH